MCPHTAIYVRAAVALPYKQQRSRYSELNRALISSYYYICNRSSSAAAAAGTIINDIRVNTYPHAAMSVPAYLLQRGAAVGKQGKTGKEKMSAQVYNCPFKRAPSARVSYVFEQALTQSYLGKEHTLQQLQHTQERPSFCLAIGAAAAAAAAAAGTTTNDNICALMLLYMSPHATICVSSYLCTCACVVSKSMCPDTTRYLCSYY
jgi:hypothetical protein